MDIEALKKECRYDLEGVLAILAVIKHAEVERIPLSDHRHFRTEITYHGKQMRLENLNNAAALF